MNIPKRGVVQKFMSIIKNPILFHVFSSDKNLCCYGEEMSYLVRHFEKKKWVIVISSLEGKTNHA